jgi:dsDNA-specific endonuclease/ATPase MutS2
MSPKQPTLDLHGFRTEDVFDAVEAFLQRYGKRPQVRIMPGKGTGKVKSKVIEYLKLSHYPWSYERLSDGSLNEGLIIVYTE